MKYAQFKRMQTLTWNTAPDSLCPSLTVWVRLLSLCRAHFYERFLVFVNILDIGAQFENKHCTSAVWCLLLGPAYRHPCDSLGFKLKNNTTWNKHKPVDISRRSISLVLCELVWLVQQLPTCRKTFSRSRGAVPVRDTAPAIAPATSCLQTRPARLSFSENSSGTVRCSPMSNI